MTAEKSERPALRTASQRLFAGVLALLFAWASMPAAVPAATKTPVVHIAFATPAATSLRDGAKIGRPTIRLSAARSHAGPDGAPPPALPPLSFGIAAPQAASTAGWVARAAPALPRRTGDLYSARAPPTLS
ncbi:hypothetical protein ASE86_05215 [Sphingomonas sp. Leaf33]|uniref:hypothetical protein n=1 Tax=Sphingomonas sp. Leaf33 TaxID=1736215 RepID=UPI0006FEA431|nr:hypothetical protein [Sphingomonas sp. Leaf33]KQN25615.1 hypothetical protein ASE86_05215 [Sphingomonas sp. Leaf33]